MVQSRGGAGAEVQSSAEHVRCAEVVRCRGGEVQIWKCRGAEILRDR